MAPLPRLPPPKVTAVPRLMATTNPDPNAIVVQRSPSDKRLAVRSFITGPFRPPPPDP
jgi:hypothetical protein